MRSRRRKKVAHHTAKPLIAKRFPSERTSHSNNLFLIHPALSYLTVCVERVETQAIFRQVQPERLTFWHSLKIHSPKMTIAWSHLHIIEACNDQRDKQSHFQPENMTYKFFVKKQIYSHILTYKHVILTYFYAKKIYSIFLFLYL